MYLFQMPRKHIRAPGTRRYGDYSEDNFNECLAAIKSGRLTQRKAAAEYNIPLRTINYKLKNKHLMRPGKPLIFSSEEELQFVKCVITMCDFGFPLAEQDLRNIIRDYLTKSGRIVKEFKDGNYPGLDWVNGFIKRHPEITIRFVSNVKKIHAAVSETMLKEYIENLSIIVEKIPPKNVWNYDETNLTDDPGTKKCLAKRGIKYPHKICNSSKTSISLMMAGNASGELLPPFVVYRSTRMWSTWCEGGPKEARYTNTTSGWFDGLAFEEWFCSLMLPCLKKSPGRKVLIGDNLSSHVSPKVLQLCQANEIDFVCLPPNSTHLTQPLDVAFFRPMKCAWRTILTAYKETPCGLKNTTLQKQDFPALLKELMLAIEPNQEANLKAGFKKCGIFPVNVEELLKSFESRKISVVDGEAIEDSFKLFLEEKRKSLTATDGKKKRRKVNVAPGKSITYEDVVKKSQDTSEPLPSTSGVTKPMKNKKNAAVINDSSSEDSDLESVSYQDSSYGEESFSDMEVIFKNKKDVGNETHSTSTKDLNNKEAWSSVKRKVGEYVVFSYEDEIFPGKIIKITKSGAFVRSMQKSGRYWKWPQIVDELEYIWKDILGHIEEPKQISKREIFSVPELSYLWDLF